MTPRAENAESAPAAAGRVASSPLRALVVAGLAVAAVVAVVGAAFTWIDLARTFAVRPLDFSEAEVQFDAARIRDHLPLYFDVVAGAPYGGSVPSRHFVVYVPTHAWILSHLPGPDAFVAARLLSTVAWLGCIAYIVLRGRFGRALVPLLYAALAAGTWGLAVYATYGRPDALALLAIGVAFFETLRRRRVGFTFAALFAVGVWIKPNILGLFVGSMVAEVLVHRARSVRAFAGVAAVSAVVAGALQAASGGAWFVHLFLSTAAPFSPRLWLDAATHYVPFYTFPIALAAWSAWRAERLGHGVLGLATSFAWTLATIGKIGAAGNYWMEPCLGALAVVATVPFALPSLRAQAVAAVAAAVQAVWIGVADVRTAIDELVSVPRQAAFLDHVRQRCGAPQRLVLSDATGTELALDGRIVLTPLQFELNAARGRFPLGVWIDVIRDPSIGCFVLHSEVTPGPRAIAENENFPPVIREELARRFVFAEAVGDVQLYVERTRP